MARSFTKIWHKLLGGYSVIFVTVGTQLPFDRLIRGVDQWAKGNAHRDVFVQTGRSTYQPQHCRWRNLISQSSFDYLLDKAEVIVAHAGIGSILSALEYGKPIIVLPRRLEFQEHRNDHQLATAERFQTMSSVHVAWEAADVARLLTETDIKGDQRSRQPTANPQLLARVREFVTQGASLANRDGLECA